MKGRSVIVSSKPKGAFIECVISGTPKPGTCMQLKSSTDPVTGRYTFEAYAPGTGDGAPGMVAVLLPDDLQGGTYSTAYVSGTRGQVYVPVAGEEINVRKADLSGTGTPTEDLNIGEKLLIVDGTGMVSPVAVGLENSKSRYPFLSLETLTDQAAEQLVHCLFLGH